jgi:penicillin-binding protein 1A
MAGRRREPRFDIGEDGDDLRATRDDRPAPSGDLDRRSLRRDERAGVRPGMRPGARRSEDRAVPALEPADDDMSLRRHNARGYGRGASAPSPRRRRSVAARLLYWGFVLSIWGAIGVAGLIAWYAVHLPPIQSLEVPQRPPNVQILALDGTLLANRGDMGGAAVALKDLPPYVGQAFIAIEDRRFYDHWGIDPFGLARAMLRNVTAGHLEQGGSTLTQQLAKNLFLTQERNLERKVQEAILAIWLERHYSKAQILEMYCNRVYFGAGAYGVEAAAQRYFGKSAKQLTLAEAAMLAGLVKAPSKLAPNHNAKLAQGRAQLVLLAMADQGFISEKAAMAAIARPATASNRSGEASSNYPADWVMDLLDDYVGPFESDIVVETTIDQRLQAAAEETLQQTLDRSGPKLRVSQGAVVMLEPGGAVRALVGGRSYAASQFNRAIAAKRQPGSTFKPFVYLAALEAGATPDTVRDDAPVRVGGWSPEDFSKEYRGPVTLSTALALSLNTVAVRLCQEVGPAAVVAVAQRLGIASGLQINPSIALGTSEVTPLELTAAYASFANGGHAIVPYVVTRVRDVNGKLLFKRATPPAPPVVSQDKVGMMNAMMSQTLTIGTARKAALGGWQAAGKSGTSQNYRDAWFIGYTRYMVASVWLGNDDSSSTKRVTGGSLPAEIWNGVMRVAHRGLAPKPLAGAPWFPTAGDSEAVVAAQPQIDGVPDDQPVAMRPTSGDRLAPDGPSLGDWIRQVLTQ